MKNVEIKKVTLEDLEKLQSISRQTFHETFASQNSAENMSTYLEASFSLEKLRKEIHNSDFYFAMEGNEPIAYLKLNLANAQMVLEETGGLEIERIYVLKSHQGKGYGNALFDLALERASENGASYIWLGVWEKNIDAIEFYKKKGMAVFDSHVFKLGDEDQMDYLMRRPLHLIHENPKNAGL
jgi:hypothetical protein